jgi:hypothetical protein
MSLRNRADLSLAQCSLLWGAKLWALRTLWTMPLFLFAVRLSVVLARQTKNRFTGR